MNTKSYIKIEYENKIVAIGYVDMDSLSDEFIILAYNCKKTLKKIGIPFDNIGSPITEFNFEFFKSKILKYSSVINPIYNLKIVTETYETDIDVMQRSFTFLVFKEKTGNFYNIVEFNLSDLEEREGQIITKLSAEDAFYKLSELQKIRSMS